MLGEARLYQVLIVEQSDESHAQVRRAEFETRDRDEALTFVNEFNADELDSPIGSWAVVRVV